MIAAQQWAALEKSQPAVRSQIARGEFEGVNAWRRENIWSQGSRWSTPELIARATGEPLDARYFMEHLKRRYLAQ
jgi:carboxypeptidase Taq